MQLIEEKANPKHLENLYNELQASGYARFSESCCLYIKEKRFLYEYRCDNCRGHGTIECSKCRGKGDIKCPNCVSGENKCNRCSGKKNILKTTSVNGQTRKYAEPCPTCHATGKIECSKCRGSARITCSRCNGNGEIVCSQCRGEGCLTDILETDIYTTPTYKIKWGNAEFQYFSEVREIVSLLDIMELELYGNVKREGIIKNNSKVLENYKVLLPVACFKVVLENKIFRWLAYSKKCYEKDMDGMIEYLLLDDVRKLDNVSKKSLWMPFLLLYSQKTIKSFMLSKTNQELLKEDGDIEAQDIKIRAKEIQSKISAHLSTEYITQSLNAMEKIVSTYCAKSDIFWFAIGLFTALNVTTEIWQDKIDDFGILKVPFVMLLFALYASGWRWIAIRIFWGKHISLWAKKINKFRYLSFPIFGSLISILFAYFFTLSQIRVQEVGF